MHVAWQAFRTVALKSTFEPTDADWGETVSVTTAGIMVEGGFSPGWPKSPHNPRSRAMPEHYELNFRRQFDLGERGDMRALELTIFVPAADELRELGADLFGGEGDEAETAAWLDEVEADPGFQVPMTRHTAERFQFGIVHVG